MSIQLPRSPKELHFTGSVRALGPEPSRGALGRERPRAAPPPPRQPPVGAGSKPPEPNRQGDDHQTTLVKREREPMRAPLVSIDEEEIKTQALDRDEINAALFPIARRDKRSRPSPNLPVPHFRSAAAANARHAERPAAPRATTTGGALPLTVWLVAAMIAAVVSYNFAPQAVQGVAQAVRTLEPR
jgi:hypothetical protein